MCVFFFFKKKICVLVSLIPFRFNYRVVGGEHDLGTEDDSREQIIEVAQKTIVSQICFRVRVKESPYVSSRHLWQVICFALGPLTVHSSKCINVDVPP